MAAFAVGCVISTVVSILQNLLQLPLINNTFYEENINIILIMFNAAWIQYLFYLVITAALFAASNYIIRNRLNLE